MTIDDVRRLVATQQVSRMMLIVDECSCCVEFFVPKKKVDWMQQWCENNIPETLNYSVGSLWSIGMTMKKGHIQERYCEVGYVDIVDNHGYFRFDIV